MKHDTMPQVAQYWNNVADEFDAIYSGKKSALGRALDRWLRRDMYQRFDWVMATAGDVRGKDVCDVGCGSGRFVTEFAKRGASHVTGVDVAPEMLRLARNVVREDGVSDRCDFIEADILNWQTDRQYDITIAIGLWDYIADPSERLRVIRKMTRGRFLSAWPRFWTLRTPIRKVRLQYIRGCPVYFFRKPVAFKLLESSGFAIESCQTIGKLFCIASTPA